MSKGKNGKRSFIITSTYLVRGHSSLEAKADSMRDKAKSGKQKYKH